ncbi:putative ATP-dependent transporter SufC [Nymphon striatum]|nr:putative ATP-dependent transporter SufC [Nymphon striatum]
MLKRALNVGFSGGEKKRAEILQMALLEPTLCVLDETDSGLDIDALKVVSEGVNALRDPARAFLVITHYQRLLDHIVPDTVHVLYNGRIIKTGDKTLALHLEENGYADVIASAADQRCKGMLKSIVQLVLLMHLPARSGTTASTRYAIRCMLAVQHQPLLNGFMGRSTDAHLSSSVVAMDIGEGAVLNYLIVQQSGLGAEHLGRISVRLAENAKLNLFILNAGGKLVRQEVKVDVAGEGAHVEIKGVNLVGDNAHIDVTTCA